jgi:hypothetical protein
MTKEAARVERLKTVK